MSRGRLKNITEEKWKERAEEGRMEGVRRTISIRQTNKVLLNRETWHFTPLQLLRALKRAHFEVANRIVETAHTNSFRSALHNVTMKSLFFSPCNAYQFREFT